MNIYQANNLDFQALLSKLGHAPVKVLKGGLDVWYHSPFRTEKEPSFHIREGREYDWVWYDFGHEGASTILDFIMQYKNTDKRGALVFLDTLYPNYKSHRTKQTLKDKNQVSFSFPPQSEPQASILKNKEQQYRDFEFIQDLPLTSEMILKYLEMRCIPRRIAFKHFRVVKYRHKEKRSQKPYFGFGMQTLSGWEVRSASDEEGQKFKTALIAKDISVIKGSEQGRGEVSVFEGMTDFASLLAMFGVDGLKGDAIILHGLKLYGRAAAYIREQGYTRINTFLDNNKSGIETTEHCFIKDFGSMVFNQSPSFAPYVDLNDALKDNFRPTFGENKCQMKEPNA